MVILKQYVALDAGSDMKTTQEERDGFRNRFDQLDQDEVDRVCDDADELARLFSDREVATIIAALRFWQQSWPLDSNESLLATDDGRLEALSDSEIDELCEWINTEMIGD